jgi:importin subunit alpha-2
MLAMAGSTSFNRFEDRKATFQRGLDFDEIRKRRDDAVGESRLKQRYQRTIQRRNLARKEGRCSFSLKALPRALLQTVPRLEVGDVEERWSLLIELFLSPSCIQLEALKGLRKQFEVDGSFPTHLIHKLPLAAGLIWALGVNCEDFQIEAAWCISNLTYEASDATLKLVAEGVILALRELLPRVDLLGDHAVCALSNIASERVLIRDLVIIAGAIELVVDSVVQHPKMQLEFLANRIWLLSRLAQGRPRPDASVVLSMLKVVRRALDTENDGIVKDCLSMLSCITEHPQVMLEFTRQKLLPQLVTHLSTATQLTLRVIGNIAAGTDSQAQQLLDCGVLDELQLYLSSKHAGVLREVAWTYSNLLAGSPTQVLQVMYHDSIAALVRLLRHDNYKVMTHTLHALNNLSCTRDPLVIRRLSELKAFEALVGLLEQPHSEVLVLSLSVIGRLFSACLGRQEYLRLLERFKDTGGLERLEKLQYHNDPQVYKKSTEVMESHYGLEEVESDLLEAVPSAFVFS